jgi:hypothetical protein
MLTGSLKLNNYASEYESRMLLNRLRKFFKLVTEQIKEVL